MPNTLFAQHAGAVDDLHGSDWSTRLVSAQNHQQRYVVGSRALFNLHTHTTSNLRGCADASETGIQQAERHQVHL